jgi:hypothetical protein
MPNNYGEYLHFTMVQVDKDYFQFSFTYCSDVDKREYLNLKSHTAPPHWGPTN